MPAALAIPRKKQSLSSDLCPDAYLTDGLRLFRVMDTLLDPWKGESIALEDCVTLRSKIYPSNVLELLGLELVRSAPVGAG